MAAVNSLLIGLTAASILLSGAAVIYALYQRRAREAAEADRGEAEQARDESATALEAAQTARSELEGERDRLATTLTEAEAKAQRYRAAMDQLPLPIWLRDDTLGLADFNSAHLAAVGMSAEDARKQQAELPEGNARTQLKNLAARARQEDAAQSLRVHAVTNGERRLFEISECPLPGGGQLGIARDLTELEERSAELKRHVDAHREVLENLDVAIAMTDPELRLVFANAAYIRLWDIEEAFLATQPMLTEVWDYLRERRRLPEQADFAEYRRQNLRNIQNLIEPKEELLHLPDGSTIRTTTSPHPLGGTLFTFEDVTDLLYLERTYNTLVAVQRETLDKLYEGVAVFGADGRLKLHNPPYREIWGFSPQALEGEPHVRQLIERNQELLGVPDERWDDYRTRLVAGASEAKEGGGRFDLTDGRSIEWTQVPLPDGASLFTYVDISDTIQVERALRERNEALETADRLKSEFIANISYELRTPLNAITGFAEILGNEYYGNLSERQKEYAEAIVKSSDQLMALINDILDLASIEAGYMQLEMDQVDVAELLSSTQMLAAERARSRQLALAIDCPKDIGCVTCDERRLRQALFNLVSNALKYTPPGGEVTVCAWRENGTLHLTVRDTGIGIPEEDQARVFGRFERAGGRGQGHGAGLGLSLVKSLIELHGGHIELASHPGEGTEVSCVLPEQPPAALGDEEKDSDGEAAAASA